MLISTESADCVNLIGELGTDVGSKRTLSGPTVLPSAAIASPVHFTDPSGQNASGQLCVAILRSPAITVTGLSRATRPFCHGTPQLTPETTEGGSLASHERLTAAGVTADPCGTEPPAAQPGFGAAITAPATAAPTIKCLRVVP